VSAGGERVLNAEEEVVKDGGKLIALNDEKNAFPIC
jgi:hypothetical protein